LQNAKGGREGQHYYSTLPQPLPINKEKGGVKMKVPKNILMSIEEQSKDTK